MAQFRSTTSVESSRVVVTLAGECDLAVRDELTAVLVAAADGTKLVFVDLTEVHFLDSSGLHALLSGHRAAIERGARLYAGNAGGPVARVLEVTGVGELLRPPADCAGPLTGEAAPHAGELHDHA